MAMFKQAVMYKYGVQMQFVKVFIGPSGWGMRVYKLYAVYICIGFMYDLLYSVCAQFRIAATRPRKVKFCCVV